MAESRSLMRRDSRLKVLFATSEVAPFVKTGALGATASALPPALAGLGVDVRVCLAMGDRLEHRDRLIELLARLRVLGRHLERAHDIARDARAAEESEQPPDVAFPARPGPLCGYCDVLRGCAEGLSHTGGVVPAAWSVLDAWEHQPEPAPG